MMNQESLIRTALDSKASHAAILDVSQIRFHEDFRKACEKNFCRKYDTNWMGPPAIGPIEKLMQRAALYKKGLLFQTVHATNGSFDMKGMLEGAKAHQAVFRELLKTIRKQYPENGILPLDAGCCSLCEKCAYLDRQPCRRPDEAVSSVEAYGINVLALQKSAGLPYSHGKNKICYVGLILFNPD